MAFAAVGFVGFDGMRESNVMDFDGVMGFVGIVGFVEVEFDDMKDCIAMGVVIGVAAVVMIVDIVAVVIAL